MSLAKDTYNKFVKYVQSKRPDIIDLCPQYVSSGDGTVAITWDDVVNYLWFDPKNRWAEYFKKYPHEFFAGIVADRYHLVYHFIKKSFSEWKNEDFFTCIDLMATPENAHIVVGYINVVLLKMNHDPKKYTFENKDAFYQYICKISKLWNFNVTKARESGFLKQFNSDTIVMLPPDRWTRLNTEEDG